LIASVLAYLGFPGRQRQERMPSVIKFNHPSFEQIMASECVGTEGRRRDGPQNGASGCQLRPHSRPI